MHIGDSWRGLWNDLKSKFIKSISNPALIFFSLATILIIGNLSFWIEAYKFGKHSDTPHSLAAMVNALITFFPAVAVPACMQLHLSNSDTKAAKALSHLVAIIIVVSAILISTLPDTLDNGWALTFAGIFTLISYIIWLVFNADNPDFSESNPETPVGGAIDAQMSGSLEGLKS